jgi:alpha-ribazole phosphatase
MTTWWWIRHGPTHARGMVGWTDLPADLSDTAALERLSAHLPEDALVVSSDLVRSVATADAIQGRRTRLPHAQAIREIHFGDWEMKTAAEIGASHPDLSRAYWSDPGPHAPPGGESWDQAATRVAGFVDAMNASHAGCNIVAVAHFGVILTQVQRAGRLAPRSALAFKIDNLSVTRLEYLDPHWRILGVNHQP